MNKISFPENSNAICGEVVAIDPDSNIFVLCPRTFSLIKTNFDASKIIQNISLKQILLENRNIEPKRTSNNTDFTDVVILEDKECLLDEENLSKNFKLISMCISIDYNIYLLVSNKDLASVYVLCFDKDSNCIQKIIVNEIYDLCGDYQSRNRRNKTRLQKLEFNLACNTNELKETKLYISSDSGVLVYSSQSGKLLGLLEIVVNDYISEYYGKIVATKKFTYIMCGHPGRSILVFEMNIDIIGLKKISEKFSKEKEQIKRKRYDFSDYLCKNVQTINGDDMGNCIFIGKSCEDGSMYLYSLNFDGKLMYKTKLFDKFILDIAVDNLTCRNYRLISAVKNQAHSSELMWIYEFGNETSEEDGEKKKKVLVSEQNVESYKPLWQNFVF
jgi:hypothetical protein